MYNTLGGKGGVKVNGKPSKLKPKELTLIPKFKGCLTFEKPILEFTREGRKITSVEKEFKLSKYTYLYYNDAKVQWFKINKNTLAYEPIGVFDYYGNVKNLRVIDFFEKDNALFVSYVESNNNSKIHVYKHDIDKGLIEVTEEFPMYTGWGGEKLRYGYTDGYYYCHYVISGTYYISLLKENTYNWERIQLYNDFLFTGSIFISQGKMALSGAGGYNRGLKYTAYDIEKKEPLHTVSYDTWRSMFTDDDKKRIVVVNERKEGSYVMAYEAIIINPFDKTQTLVDDFIEISLADFENVIGTFISDNVKGVHFVDKTIENDRTAYSFVEAPFSLEVDENV